MSVVCNLPYRCAAGGAGGVSAAAGGANMRATVPGSCVTGTVGALTVQAIARAIPKGEYCLVFSHFVFLFLSHVFHTCSSKGALSEMKVSK